jgi:small subunit ribosomal protein S16
MVKVRLFRTGARNKPSWRIVAIDERKKRQGRIIELLGTYEPRHDGALNYSEEKLAKWVECGAQVSDTVASLVRRHKRSAGAVAKV